MLCDPSHDTGLGAWEVLIAGGSWPRSEDRGDGRPPAPGKQGPGATAMAVGRRVEPALPGWVWGPGLGVRT